MHPESVCRRSWSGSCGHTVAADSLGLVHCTHHCKCHAPQIMPHDCDRTTGRSHTLARPPVGAIGFPHPVHLLLPLPLPLPFAAFAAGAHPPLAHLPPLPPFPFPLLLAPAGRSASKSTQTKMYGNLYSYNTRHATSRNVHLMSTGNLYSHKTKHATSSNAHEMVAHTRLLDKTWTEMSMYTRRNNPSKDCGRPPMDDNDGPTQHWN